MIFPHSSIQVDSSRRELYRHGTTPFPISASPDVPLLERVPWHWHDELEVALITDGPAIINAGNETYTLETGDGIFINSGVLHGSWQRTDSDRVCDYHSLTFHPRLIGGSIDSVFSQNYVQPLVENRTLESICFRRSNPWQAEALRYVESVWHLCQTAAHGYEFRVRSQLSELILLMEENLPVQKQVPDSKVLRDGERIKQMLQFIHEHFSEPLTTKEIAACCAISESECLRCFRATVSTTPIQYLRQYRIQQAAHLLTTTRMRIADIAMLCGFSDISYFTKTFRELCGTVPTEYRQTHT